VNKDITVNANIFNLFDKDLFDKDFLKFNQWTNLAGDTVWGSPYVKSTAATKGTLPAGRTLWISASMNF